jgi:hypothetical protein
MDVYFYMLTLSSCFYVIKSKFDTGKYIEWMNNFISICNNFNLVIYTDKQSAPHINTRGNPRIRVVIKPIDQFHCYKYRDSWIQNHAKNVMLNAESQFNTAWELNMLWSEKIAFVQETVTNRYFETEYYGWCDIGYFRNRSCDTHTSVLMAWPTIHGLDKTKIHYACVNRSRQYINQLVSLINRRGENGLPIQPIPPNQHSVAGGFFILHRDKLEWWSRLYYQTLESYFANQYLVKDDQIVIADCVFSHLGHFKLYNEVAPYDNWFMFQRLLL